LKKIALLWAVLLALSVLVGACRAPAPSTVAPTTVDPQAVHTAAAATAGAILTAMVPPSETPAPPTPTNTTAPEVTQAPTPELPLFTATATSASTGQDASAFVSETIPDGSEYTSNATFVKTWEFRNSGTTTWTTDYTLVFVSGAQMGAPASIPLPYAVPPGTIVPVSLNLTAPADPGNYRGYWQLKNAAGQIFGVSVWVDINVVNATATPGETEQPTATPTSEG
jgi:hypothetical protein